MIRRAVIAAVVCVSSFSFAQDAGTPAQDAGAPAPVGPLEPPPSAEMIKQVVDYLENGKDRGRRCST